MSNKKRRLQRVNRQQILGIFFIVLAGVLAYSVFRDQGRVVSAHFVLPDGSKTAEFTADVVVSESERNQGLMFVKSMPKRKGMLFVFPTEDKQSFWMKNTYIPLDMIFINSNLEVVGIVRDAKPLSSKKKEVEASSRYVLELNSGEVDEHGIVIGAKLAVPLDILSSK